ncbi:2-amino-4-hydroxy-6-hydroxymethyldihydropteridine diphosphokinase [Marinobacter sp. OP 3.4]|uniref:2-amino-4-hydroxy-6- hydroxymethyldihydropteridine diphosphokinase n=1 Tax=Marinobacter sp. OP 3.4 TaxID=3076501 RepID=UPI002E242550
MWYLCGLGSNIAPKHNLPLAVARLARLFGPVSLSPVVRTAPQGMASDNSFLNALAVFQSDLPPDRVKQHLNELEESLGRDRSDPDSSVRDRPIDVDILESRNRPGFSGQAITEDYYRRLLEGEAVRGEPLLLEGWPLGEAPATIDWNQGAGDEIVVQQGDNLLYHAVKTALPG